MLFIEIKQQKNTEKSQKGKANQKQARQGGLTATDRRVLRTADIASIHSAHSNFFAREFSRHAMTAEEEAGRTTPYGDVYHSPHRKMGKAEVERYFHEIGRDDLQIMEFETSSATVELAAAAIGAEPELIAKTLSYRLKERDIVIVVSGTARVNNRKFKDAFQCKAKMMSAEEALQLTGHPIGGVCPFGLATPVQVYLDESLRRFEYVYPAAGAANNAVKIKVSEFAEIARAEWVDVTETPQAQE